MRQRSTSAISILLLISVGMACSLLRPKRAFAWHIMLESQAPPSDRETAIRRTVSVIELRLEAASVHTFAVVAQGSPPNGRILVSLPEVPDRARLIELITVTGQLELVAVVSPPSPAPAQTYNTQEEAVASLGEAERKNRSVLPYTERDEPAPGTQGSKAPMKWVVIERPAIVDGSNLRNAVASRASGEEYVIAFSLKPEGAERFELWTESHINEYLGVALNGEVKSIAYIKSRISDQGEISGRFTKQSAEDLALVLRSGALPAPVKVVEQGNNN